jgi:2-polyprenyl-3-methyl-5-hydroxy-6-metoxy-1,4-benzoquinol methylase
MWRVFLIGVDIFGPFIKEAKVKYTHTHYIIGDIRKVEFKPKCFDAVIMLEVLEHIPKKMECF